MENVPIHCVHNSPNPTHCIHCYPPQHRMDSRCFVPVPVPSPDHYSESPFPQPSGEYPRGLMWRPRSWQDEPQPFPALVQRVLQNDDAVVVPAGFVVAFLTVNVVCPINMRRVPENGSVLLPVVCESESVNELTKIKLFGADGSLVGHMDRRASLTLIPWIDSGVVSPIRGYVLRPASNRWRQRGYSFVYSFKCRVHARVKTVDLIRVCDVATGRGMEVVLPFNPEIDVSAPTRVETGITEILGRDIDEIMKRLERSVSKRVASRPVEACRDVVRSELFQHQKEALGWMIQREGSNELPPFWEAKLTGFYSDTWFGIKTRIRPVSLRGGIYADDMGLGKTLTLIALIAHDRSNCGDDTAIKRARVSSTVVSTSTCVSSHANGCEPSGSVTPLTIGESSSEGVSRKRSYESSHGCDSRSRTTLVVCPPSVCSTWASQLEEHTNPHSLKVCYYYGKRKETDAEWLRRCDIVLTTYTIVGAELLSSDVPSSPLKRMSWWRIILDEAHVIKSLQSNAGKALLTLQAPRRWVVTGAPIQNKTQELHPLMAFLQVDPFADEALWRSVISKPLSRGKPEALDRLRVLLASVSLRRTKAEALRQKSNKSEETQMVKLSIEERQVYSVVEAEARVLFGNYYVNGRTTNHYSTVLHNILLLRQICDCLFLSTPPLIQDVATKPELELKLAADVQESAFDCPICFTEQPSCVTITRCRHTFCLRCIVKAARKVPNPRCPLCRRPILITDLFTLRNPSAARSSSASSKIDALISRLTACRFENPARKSVVFSHFKKMLEILEQELTLAGFKAVRVDGSSTNSSKLVAQFSNAGTEGPTILLSTFQLCKASVDLSAATRVYLIEPWWNPAVEDQAVSRVHHTGQKENVEVVKFVTKDSVEEMIVKMQGEKRKVAREAFGEGSSSGAAAANESEKALVDSLLKLMLD